MTKPRSRSRDKHLKKIQGMSTLTIPAYNDCVSNLNNFTYGLLKNPVKILYLYFNKDAKKPRVKTKFGEWKFPSTGETFYVIPGESDEYAYVYSTSGLKALIDVSSPNKPSPMNASFDSTAPYTHAYEVNVLGPVPSSTTSSQPNEVFIGNHLDFSINSYTRNNQRITVVSAHVTKYDIDPQGTATRDATVYSDFTFENIINTPNILQTKTDFENIHHEVRGMSTGLTIGQIFNPQDTMWLLPFYNLTRKTIGLAQLGGSINKQYHMYNKKKYLIRQGPKGGKYIVVNSEKKYVPQLTFGGGTYSEVPTSMPSEERDIEPILNGEDFSDIIYDMFVKPIGEIETNLEGVRVVFDYGKVLTEHNDSSHFEIIYEFEKGRILDVFVVPTDIVLQSIEENKTPSILNKPNNDKLRMLGTNCKNRIMRRRPRAHS